MPEILIFAHLGPNRRSDRRVVEVRLDFAADNGPVLTRGADEIRDRLLEAGVIDARDDFPGASLPREHTARSSELLARTALALQRGAGHRVSEVVVIPGTTADRCVALVEHEHAAVGVEAVKLAVAFMSGRAETLGEAWQSFGAIARGYALPTETGRIIERARRRAIPVFQLEREPLTGRLKLPYQVRRNGLLMLGHGARNHVLDGTFCLDRAGEFLKALRRNPEQRAALLKRLGIRVGRTPSGGYGPGERLDLLVSHKRTWCLADLDGGGRHIVADAPPGVVDAGRAILDEVGTALVAVSVDVSGTANATDAQGPQVLDFDLTPDLDALLGPGEEQEALMDAVIDDLLDWLFPDPAASRIPLVAVTGTNGKTTTSRMIAHIKREAGHKPGLVCTDGIFIDGQQVGDTDASSLVGHARVLTSKAVDVAVLETHHRGIAVRGFAFDRCDVGVCLNVTHEHVQPGEIETVEEMAEIKRALVERAGGSAVLFADDALCAEMIGHTDAGTLCLVSLQSGVERLRDMSGGRKSCFCVLEPGEGGEWIVLYDGEKRLPVMAVKRIPATFDGAARFNVSNAMHAAAASYLSGTPVAVIEAALAGFRPGPEMTPGRLNVFDDLPFRIIMDFAHSADGMSKICEFTDRLTVPGRKLIAFAGMSERDDTTNRKVAQAVAGHFDFYFCKDYDPTQGPKVKYVAPLLRQVLLEEGVAAEQTRVLTFGKEAIFSIFDDCRPGDLLILLVGHVEKRTVPGYIREYAQRAAADQTEAGA